MWKVSDITNAMAANYLHLDYSSMTEDEVSELEIFMDSAKSYISGQTGLPITKTATEDDLDSFPEFVIVLYVLVQDMYDNRSYYVENAKENSVVSDILAMHSINLLPSE